MKAKVFSLLLVASIVSYSFTNYSPDRTSEAKVLSGSAFYKLQLSHLHHIEAIDLSAYPSLFPLDKTERVYVGSPFGMRKHPIHRIKKMHKGQDFAAPVGTPVIATADGVVTRVENKKKQGYGLNVMIEHDQIFEEASFATRYAHLSRAIIGEGEAVKRGDIIGYSGNSGTSTAPHLHYEVIQDGDQVDPEKFMF